MKKKLFGYDGYTVLNLDYSGLAQALTAFKFNNNAEVDSKYVGNYSDASTIFPKEDLMHFSYNMDCHGNRLVTQDALFDNNANKGILKTAKTVFIHPNCSIPRTMIHFKKTLNPWMADAVIVPQIRRRNETLMFFPISIYTAIFVDESQKTALVYQSSSWTNADFINSMKDILPSSMGKSIKTYYGDTDKCYDLNAQLVYFGTSVEIADNKQFMIALLNREYPVNKIVTEDELLPYNSSENNAMTIDAYNNIKEMLLSDDVNVQIVGMKALSCMDYYTYTNTILKLLKDTKYKWQYEDKVKAPSTVKFMFRYLGYSNGLEFWSTITHKDFDLMDSMDFLYDKNNNNTPWSKLLFFGKVYIDKDNTKLEPRFRD